MKLFSLFLVVIGLAIAVPSHAQTPGAYNIVATNGVSLNGGTNNVGNASTNTYAAFACSEFTTFGLQLSFAATAPSNTVIQVFGYKSLDSTTYETVPSLSTLITFNGTTNICTNFSISVPDASNYKIAIGNTNAAVALTNLVAVRRFKAGKVKGI